MQAYIIRRVWLGILTAFLVSLFVFAILRIAPGDVALAILGSDEGAIFTQEDIDRLRDQLGLNRPLPVQYLTWMRDMVTLQWGNSLLNDENIWLSFRKKIPVTLELVIMSVGLSTLIGIPAGVIMALRQDTWADYVIRILSLSGLSVPNFWIATMIIVGGMVFFNWGPAILYEPIHKNFTGNLLMFVWPALAIGVSSMATKSRMMRSSMLEVLRQDYVRTAHAKGLRPFVITYRHVMKNALLPVVTILGFSIALSVGGSVIMETIFQLPGIGRYLVQGLQTRDYPVVQSLVLLLSIWVVTVNLLVDLSYAMLDPRIRFD